MQLATKKIQRDTTRTVNKKNITTSLRTDICEVLNTGRLMALVLLQLQVNPLELFPIFFIISLASRSCKHSISRVFFHLSSQNKTEKQFDKSQLQFSTLWKKNTHTRQLANKNTEPVNTTTKSTVEVEHDVVQLYRSG